MRDFSDLINKKNLLGFSGGADSVALFFLLLQENIEFDIAIVDYQIREQSFLEVEYAYQLAKRFNKKIYVHHALKISNNFEDQARRVRYDFFEQIIRKFYYENLLLAHHLNDRLEWFLMQLIKGSGLNNLLGFERIEKRKDYSIIRPLLKMSKDEILDIAKQYQYFEDLSNKNIKYMRNHVRIKYANSLIKEYKKGILKSFDLLLEEKQQFYNLAILNIEDLFYFQRTHTLQNLNHIDKILKKFGYVLSIKQRKEIVQRDYDLVIAKDFIITKNKKFIFITLNNISIPMPKYFREEARIKKIPKRIRPKVFMLLKQGIIIKSKILFN